jgi:hypothetical protein
MVRWLWKHLKRMAGGYHKLIQGPYYDFQTLHGKGKEFGVDYHIVRELLPR